MDNTVWDLCWKQIHKVEESKHIIAEFFFSFPPICTLCWYPNAEEENNLSKLNYIVKKYPQYILEKTQYHNDLHC